MKTLVVVDMQNDFITGSLGTKEAEAIVPKVREKIAEAIANGDKIIFTQDTHFDDYLETQEGKNLPVKHCIKDTDGWQIRAELAKYCQNVIFDKPTFGSRELGEYLVKSNEEAKIDSITFIGLCTDICVISNVMLTKAFLPEVPVIGDAACCAGVTPASHNNALEAMKMCQVKVENE